MSNRYCRFPHRQVGGNKDEDYYDSPLRRVSEVQAGIIWNLQEIHVKLVTLDSIHQPSTI